MTAALLTADCHLPTAYCLLSLKLLPSRPRSYARAVTDRRQSAHGTPGLQHRRASSLSGGGAHFRVLTVKIETRFADGHTSRAESRESSPRGRKPPYATLPEKNSCGLCRRA